MNTRVLLATIAATGLLLPLPTASAAPSFGPGNYALRDGGEVISSWSVAGCGDGCLAVTTDDQTAKFSHESDDRWMGNWHVVDGACYDRDGTELAAKATWSTYFIVYPDLSVLAHVIDEVGCDGQPGEYDDSYVLTPTV